MKPLRVGLIGCGKVAIKHITALQRLSSENLATLVALSDSSSERLQSVANLEGVKTFLNFREMLDQAELDLAIVATPSGTHAEIGMEVAQRKVNLITEKPMALTLQDADRLIETCSQNQVRLFEIKQNRFNRPVIKTKEAVSQGRLGKIVMATAQVFWHRDQSYYQSSPWRGTWTLDGGVFANQAIHHLDLLLWLLGAVESVMAKGATLLHDIEAEDTGVAMLRFANGALGVLQTTVCARPNVQEGSVTILGESGTIRLGGFSADQIALWDFAQPHPADEEVMKNWSHNPKAPPFYPHYECLKDIALAIHKQRPAVIDGHEARKTLELINAIYESMETGREVFLMFRPKHSKLGRDHQ